MCVIVSHRSEHASCDGAPQVRAPKLGNVLLHTHCVDTLGCAMTVILCIDGDVWFLKRQKSILGRNEYTVLIAPDGPTGIALASQHPADVVVLAMKMPGMDGGQVAEVLLKQQPDLPILIYTGFFDAVPKRLRWFAAACLQKRDSPQRFAFHDSRAGRKQKGSGWRNMPSGCCRLTLVASQYDVASVDVIAYGPRWKLPMSSTTMKVS